MDNEKVLNDGLKKAYNIIVEHLKRQMFAMCERLVDEVPKHREFQGFTGNTQTSYACGLYFDGSLTGIVKQRQWSSPPLSKKIGKDKWLRLTTPYEGVSRAVKGQVDVSNGYGIDTSIGFLKGYKAKRDHIEIVMTTGTEYSVLLESIKHLDVLTGTYEAAKEILLSGFKPINSGM